MFESPLLSLDTRILIALITLFVLKIVTALQALRLHRKVHLSPYTLAAASEDKKRNWAIRLILWRTGWVMATLPLLLLFSEFFQAGLLRFSLIGFVIWLVWVPIAVFREIYAMEKSLEGYQRWHVALKAGKLRDPKTELRYSIFPYYRWMTEELRQFEDEGFS